jgi:hypothetical protein
MYRLNSAEGERGEQGKEGVVCVSEAEAEWGSLFPTLGAKCQEAGSSTPHPSDEDLSLGTPVPLRYAQNDSAKDGAPRIDATYGTQHWSEKPVSITPVF